MQRIAPRGLLRSLAARPLTPADFPAAAALCRGNPLYYEHFGAPPPGPEDIAEDLAALPPGKGPEDKFYLGCFDESGRLRALLDLIDGYPGPETAWIGFFMLDEALQGRGFGSALVSELLAALAAAGFERVRLGVVVGNPQAGAFWRKNGFRPLGGPRPGEPRVQVMERELMTQTNIQEESI